MREVDSNLTDAEKIDWLWKRLDALNQELESTKVLLKREEDLSARKQELIEQRDVTISHLTGEIRRLGVEVNAARSAAANSVKEYIRTQEAV
jgi:hypothetical protein